MKRTLILRALSRYLLGLVLTACLLFLPAGSLRFWNGWLLLGILFVPMFFMGLALLCRNPQLLEERLNAREQAGEQKTVIALSGLLFLTGFLLSGLNARFSWLLLPKGVSLAAAAVFLLAYALYGEVLRENTYLSRTIRVQAGQRVVDTGLYGIVRHPMYSVTVLLFLAMPLVLGSPQAFALFLLYPLLLVKRIRNEEALLERELEGYRDYERRVRYRLLPFVW